VVRGFTLPIEISEETIRAEENRQTVRSALQAHAQSQVHPDSYAAHKLNTTSRLMTYPGTGIRVDSRVTDEVHPFNNPAYKAGVRLNDVIMSVNNIDARTSTFEILLKALQGNAVTPGWLGGNEDEPPTRGDNTSGIIHSCATHTSGSTRGVAIVAIDHVVCVGFARPEVLPNTASTSTLAPSSSSSSQPQSSSSSSAPSSSSTQPKPSSSSLSRPQSSSSSSSSSSTQPTLSSSSSSSVPSQASALLAASSSLSSSSSSQSSSSSSIPPSGPEKISAKALVSIAAVIDTTVPTIPTTTTATQPTSTSSIVRSITIPPSGPKKVSTRSKVSPSLVSEAVIIDISVPTILTTTTELDSSKEPLNSREILLDSNEAALNSEIIALKTFPKPAYVSRITVKAGLKKK
jgi:hypothetical protein